MTSQPRTQTVVDGEAERSLTQQEGRLTQQPLPKPELTGSTGKPEDVNVYVIVPRKYLDDVLVAGGFRPELVYEIAPKFRTTDAAFDAFIPKGKARRSKSTRIYPMAQEFALQQDAGMGAVVRVSLLPNIAVKDVIYVIGLYEKMVKAQGGAIASGSFRSDLESLSERYWKSHSVPVESFSRQFVKNPTAYFIGNTMEARLLAVHGESDMELWAVNQYSPRDISARNTIEALLGVENMEYAKNVVPEILLPEGYTPAAAVVRA